MPRMLDLVCSCALPSHQMISAAKGALRVPAAEMVEILVHLAEHNKIFAEQARLTLASWDETSAKAIASDPGTPKEVLDYWLSPKNLRPMLFPLLIENHSVPASKLSELAGTVKGEWVDAMLSSPRVRASEQTLTELRSNKALSGTQAAKVESLLTGGIQAAANSGLGSTPVLSFHLHASVPVAVAPVEPAATAAPESHEAVSVPEEGDPEVESALVAYFTDHATEIAAGGEKPFQAIGGIYDELKEEGAPAQASAAAAAASPTATPATPKPVIPKKLANAHDEQRGSVLQKITKLDIKGRIQLAMKGTKEERSILVRDGTKIVALAVLDSPKISDGEVEKIASQKNVLEAVLRTIPLKRRFAKNYAVVRNLVFNPRTPLDVSLGLMKNLLVQDLRNLAGNKEVAETIRKLALRMFKQKAEAANKK